MTRLADYDLLDFCFRQMTDAADMIHSEDLISSTTSLISASYRHQLIRLILLNEEIKNPVGAPMFLLLRASGIIAAAVFLRGLDPQRTSMP
jgi:hypothetical protein